MKHARPDYDRIQDPAGLIPNDEPVFLLRGQDRHAAQATAYYATLVSRDPDADPQIARLAYEQAAKMSAWAVKKSPDLP